MYAERGLIWKGGRHNMRLMQGLGWFYFTFQASFLFSIFCAKVQQKGAENFFYGNIWNLEFIEKEKPGILLFISKV